MSGTGLATGAGLGRRPALDRHRVPEDRVAVQGPRRGVAATGAVEESEAAQTITLAQAAEDTNATANGGGDRRHHGGFEPLANNAKALINSYGLTHTQVRLLRDFCEENGITVALRSRSARAAELIQKGIAVGKNLVIKIKNVDNIDVAFLDYSRADLNTVVWAKPITEGQLQANIVDTAGVTPELEPRRSTYATRVKEWDTAKYHEMIEKWTLTKQIELRFDGAGSSAAALDEDRTVYRRFELGGQTVPPPYGRLMVGVKPGDAARLAESPRTSTPSPSSAATGRSSALPPESEPTNTSRTSSASNTPTPSPGSSTARSHSKPRSNFSSITSPAANHSPCSAPTAASTPATSTPP